MVMSCCRQSFGDGMVLVMAGGPMRRISVNGRIIEFEMHPYSGPAILKRNGEPLKKQPMDFLHAASLWAQQGEKIDENGLCVWYHEPKEILRHLGGRHWLIVGYEELIRGQ